MGIVVGILLLLMAVGGLIHAFERGAQTIRDATVPNSFASLGIVKGKSKSEIRDAVGAPTHVSVQGENEELWQWITANYHIALIFNGDICGGITHESTSR
jgi:hypothetical protein